MLTGRKHIARETGEDAAQGRRPAVAELPARSHLQYRAQL